jgi:hypothetical protein
MPVTMIDEKPSTLDTFVVAAGTTSTTFVVKSKSTDVVVATIFINPGDEGQHGSTVLLLKTGVKCDEFNSGQQSALSVNKLFLSRGSGKTQVQYTFTGKNRPKDLSSCNKFINDFFSGPKGKDEAPAPSGAGPAPSGAGPVPFVAAPPLSGNAWKVDTPPTPSFTDDQQKQIVAFTKNRDNAASVTTSLEKEVSDLLKALAIAKEKFESAKRMEEIHDDILSSTCASFINQNKLASFESVPSKVTSVNAEEPSELTAAEVAKKMGWTFGKYNK